MNKKYIAIILTAIVIILGLFLYVRAGGDSAKYYIEKIENFSDSVGSFLTPTPEGPMGAIVFNEGRTTFDQLAEGVLQEKIVTVASLSIDTIADTPVELLPDAGTGKVNQLVSIIGFRKFSSESFSFNQIVQSHEGFEVKWGSPDVTASGLNGHVALGASFSTGFTTGDAGSNNGASLSVEVWNPSGKTTGGGGNGDTSGNDLASKSYAPTYLASQSAVYLTASSAFKTDGRDRQTSFMFRVIYRVLSIPF